MQNSIKKDIRLVKNRILPLLLNSDDIMEFYLVKDIQNKFGVTDDNDDSGIVYKQVFPHLYIDDTQTERYFHIYYIFEGRHYPGYRLEQ